MDDTTPAPQAEENTSVDLADSLEFEASEETPSEDKVDTPATESTTATDSEAKATDGADNAAEETPEESQEGETQEVTEEKTESELKGMSRRERQEYFENFKQTQAREIDRSIDQAYQPQPLDELTQAFLNQTNEYGEPRYDQFQAEMLARETVREQRAQIAEARAEIRELNAGLQADAIDVVHDIPWLDKESTANYDKDSAEIASDLYGALCVTRDPNSKQIIEARMSPKEFYGAIDKIRSAGSASAQLKAQKALEQQLASVAPQGSTAPSSPSSADDKQAASLSDAFSLV